MSLGYGPGRRRKALIIKSEDLPGMKLDSHESLAENMRICPETIVFGLRVCAGFCFFRQGVWQRLFPCAMFPADLKG